MNISKQALLGAGVLLGGSVLLYATVHQVVNTSQTAKSTDNAALVANDSNSTNASANAHGAPLTADLQTEKDLLAAKQREREARVQQQEHAAQQYMTEQQRIEAEALAKSRAENQLYMNPRVASASASTPITRPVVSPRPTEVTPTTVTVAPKPVTPIANTQTEVKKNLANTTANSTPKAESKPVAPTPVVKETTTAKAAKPVVTTEKTEKAATKPVTTTPTGSYQVKAGEGLIGLSRRYNVPVEALAAANNLNKNASLRVGQNLTIPSVAQVQRLQQQAQQEAQKKQQYQAAQQKLQEARNTVKETDAKGTFGVQVALATDQKKADEIVKELKAAGYKVKTSQTSRGVRVVVGPENGKVAALALKDKVNSDPKLKASNAWVLYW